MAADILLTKLHAPALPDDWIVRPRLLERLEQGHPCPLTLVSAPAGYGKSICVAAWLESRDEPNAWLSLDPGDSDPGTFATYLVAAVRTMFPEACPETQGAAGGPGAAAVLGARAQPRKRAGRDRDALHPGPGRLPIHRSPAFTICSPSCWCTPRRLHLIVITRRDPPLPLGSLRGRGQLAEVRLQDLQFDRSESDAFLAQSTRLSLSDRALAHLQEVIEGWPVGLRLVALALRGRRDPERFLCGLNGATREVQEYLVEEVLPGLPALAANGCSGPRSSTASALRSARRSARGRRRPGAGARRTGVLEAILRRTACSRSLSTSEGDGTATTTPSGGFCGIVWKSQCSQDEIAALHSRAARWFDENDLPEEALHHALAAGDHERARAVVRRNRNELVNSRAVDPTRSLARPASRSPSPTRIRHCWSPRRGPASTGVAAARRSISRRRRSGSPPVLRPRPSARRSRARSDALHALHEYNFGHTEKALTCSERALVELPCGRPWPQGLRPGHSSSCPPEPGRPPGRSRATPSPRSRTTPRTWPIARCCSRGFRTRIGWKAISPA